MSTTDFVRCLNTSIRATLTDDTRRMVRFYCVERGARWALQIRGHRDKKNGAPGLDFMVAHASLSRADLFALRDEITAALAELDHAEAEAASA